MEFTFKQGRLLEDIEHQNTTGLYAWITSDRRNLKSSTTTD